MVIIGLTGSVAMGKTTASNIIKSFGVPVFDSDEVVSDLLCSNRIIRKIGEIFPEAISDKGLDRVLIAKLAFTQPKKLSKLEKTLHPEVAKLRNKWLRRMVCKKEKAVVFDVPLLFETNGDLSCDIVMVTTAPFKIQMQRALSREGWNKERFYGIIKKQIPDIYKKKLADFIIPSFRGKRTMRIMIKEALNYSLSIPSRPISAIYRDLEI